MKLIKSESGFSILELLIIMAVMSVITTFALPSFKGMKTKASVAKAEKEIQTLKSVVESYYRHDNAIPKSLSDLYAASPALMTKDMEDPFHTVGTTYKYVYNYGINGSGQYIYIIVSQGPDGNYVAPTVKNNGTNRAYISLKMTSDDIIASNVPVVRE